MKINRMLTLLAVLALVFALGLVAGCGKKQAAPQTDAEVVEDIHSADPVPTTPTTPEQPAEEKEDYSQMQPSEMGIEDVYFAYDSFELDDTAMRALSQNARILKDHPEVTVMVEGHCDERGTVEYNLALGEKRAKAARDYLASLGVGGGQLKTTSYGENKPFATGTGEDVWAKNRRAHFSRP